MGLNAGYVPCCMLSCQGAPRFAWSVSGGEKQHGNGIGSVRVEYQRIKLHLRGLQ